MIYTAEVRAWFSRRARRLWEDPEFRAKVASAQRAARRRNRFLAEFATEEVDDWTSDLSELESRNSWVRAETGWVQPEVRE